MLHLAEVGKRHQQATEVLGRNLEREDSLVLALERVLLAEHEATPLFGDRRLRRSRGLLDVFATTVRSAVETSSHATRPDSPAPVAPRADVSRSPAAAGGAASEASVAASSPPLQPEATNTALTNITVNHRPRMSSPFRRLPEGADRTTTEADRFPDPSRPPRPNTLAGDRRTAGGRCDGGHFERPQYVRTILRRPGADVGAALRV